jgi:hypothetical protein
MFAPVLQLPLIGVGLEQFIVLLIAALAGGAFGAALGALPAFIFTGFVVFLGEGLAILQREVGSLSEVPTGELAVGITGVIGFGMVTGPHIAFAGGVAATAYAGKKYPEMEPDDWDYHFGKDILYAFGTKPDILAVGAIFGALGLLVTRVFTGIIPTDTVALSVVATAVIARVAFGYPLVGRAAGSGLLDMSPFERGEQEAMTDGGTGSVGMATEPWLPHQYKWSGVATIGVVAGILAAYIYIITESIFLGYGISAISLLFLNLGVEKIPVTHHITLLGSVGAAIATATIGGGAAALLLGGAFGAVSGLLGEFTQRLFYSHSGTHVDPPAMAIVIFMLVLGILRVAGVIPTTGYLGL